MAQKRVPAKVFKELAKSGEGAGLVICKTVSAGFKSVDDPSNRVREFILSTNSVDRDNDSIDQNGWDLTAFNKSGAFLWAHDSHLPPVGEPIFAFVEPVNGLGDALKIRVRFPSPDMPHPLDGKSGEGFGYTVMRMYDEGLMKAVSAGFIPTEYVFNEERGGYAADYKAQELLEGSAVPVPSNRDCLLQARSKGIQVDPIVNWAEETLSKEGDLWLPLGSKEPIKQLLDSAAKPSVTVPETIEREEKSEESEAVETKEVETSDDDLDSAIEKAIAAEAEAIDRVMKTVAQIARRGRALSEVNDAKLRAVADVLAKALKLETKKAEPEEEPAEEQDEEPTDEEIQKAVEEAMKRATDELRLQLTGGLAV